jgi:hypothetical protein
MNDQTAFPVGSGFSRDAFAACGIEEEHRG